MHGASIQVQQRGAAAGGGGPVHVVYGMGDYRERRIFVP
eukprot:COSAG01_NODE_23_length_37704_cov_30.005877_52_plen_39_part_00